LAPQSADFLFQNSGTLTSNLSNNANEFLNSKINNLASSISSDLEIGFSGLDFTKANQYRNINSNLWEDLQLRFSYKFLNDRLRITRDGRLSYGQNQYDATSLLLDWTLEYWFTEDGSQRLKAYSRNIQNQFTLSSSGVSYGVSFLYSRSFNNFKELETTPSQLYFKLKKNDTRPLTSQVQPIN
jgi:hypothetical protein